MKERGAMAQAKVWNIQMDGSDVSFKARLFSRKPTQKQIDGVQHKLPSQTRLVQMKIIGGPASIWALMWDDGTRIFTSTTLDGPVKGKRNGQKIRTDYR